MCLFNQWYWVIGGTLGGLCGPILPFDSTGMDFAMTALFVVIFVEQWLNNQNHVPALLGVGISLKSNSLMLSAMKDHHPYLILNRLIVQNCEFLINEL